MFRCTVEACPPLQVNHSVGHISCVIHLQSFCMCVCMYVVWEEKQKAYFGSQDQYTLLEL